MIGLHRFRLAYCPFLAAGALSTLRAADVGPCNGSLVISRGGLRDEAIEERFFELAGGLDSPIVEFLRFQLSKGIIGL